MVPFGAIVDVSTIQRVKESGLPLFRVAKIMDFDPQLVQKYSITNIKTCPEIVIAATAINPATKRIYSVTFVRLPSGGFRCSEAQVRWRDAIFENYWYAYGYLKRLEQRDQSGGHRQVPHQAA